MSNGPREVNNVLIIINQAGLDLDGVMKLSVDSSFSYSQTL